MKTERMTVILKGPEMFQKKRKFRFQKRDNVVMEVILKNNILIDIRFVSIIVMLITSFILQGEYFLELNGGITECIKKQQAKTESIMKCRVLVHPFVGWSEGAFKSSKWRLSSF